MLVWNRPALLFISLRLATGAMGHGPEMFQTFNQQHNPLQKFGKIAKTYGALRQGLRWAPMGPMGQPLKKTTTGQGGHVWVAGRVAEGSLGSWTGSEILLYFIMYMKYMYVRKWLLLKRN